MKINKKSLLIITITVISIVLSLVFIFSKDLLAPTRILIKTLPQEATLKIGEKGYTSPATINLKPGKYKIEAVKDGYFASISEIDVIKNKDNNINISLKEIPSSYKERLSVWNTLTDEEKLSTRTLADQRAEKEKEDFLKTHPLVQHLPYKTLNIEIVNYSEDKYWVTLIYNQSSPIDKNSQYKNAKEDAISWIKSKNLDPSTLNLEWVYK